MTNSCGKDVEESIIDCLGETALASVKYAADPANPKKINFTYQYDGKGTLHSVKWTFGDGKTETVNGNTVSHIYETAGGYSAEGDAVVSINKSQCTLIHKKGVTVE